MGRTKGWYCPDCLEQVTASCKICICGGTPAPRRPNSSSNMKKSSSTMSPGVKIRRTERIKRGKPDYYDPLEYERQAKKERKLRKTGSGRITNIPTSYNNGRTRKEPEVDYSAHRMQLKEKKKKKKPEIEPPKDEEELEEIILSQETLAKFSLILEEINRKIYASSWRVYID